MAGKSNFNPLGCLLAPFAFVWRQLRLVILIVAIIFALCGASALFLPNFFNQLIKSAQSAGLSIYTLALSVTGNPSLKLITYETVVKATVRVERSIGILSLLYGESASATGEVRVALGADLQARQVGVLSCEINTETLRTSTDRALFASAAFDSEQIKQATFRFFKEEAARQAIKQHWSIARERLRAQFVSQVLGFEVPEQPTLTDCPTDFNPLPTPTPQP
ncbi:MAG: hypothetical protein CUN49_02565 [Candidatus Thermofonsia Clade 1 bacterium]|jgi:hypothetical protein|uniref:DUF4230 domain-containing protein n=1 Tax=Candidatus Thermofonsia Clade 1 bacterium TaxID=2364210 RepID=A0A2M8PHI6_9CHLR|nr:MAG: hypothetical protein CUN49_02565 [Candidatus Thermofonsia Clade 1 bacterium]